MRRHPHALCERQRMTCGRSRAPCGCPRRVCGDQPGAHGCPRVTRGGQRILCGEQREGCGDPRGARGRQPGRCGGPRIGRGRAYRREPFALVLQDVLRSSYEHAVSWCRDEWTAKRRGGQRECGPAARPARRVDSGESFGARWWQAAPSLLCGRGEQPSPAAAESGSARCRSPARDLRRECRRPAGLGRVLPACPGRCGRWDH